MKFTRNKNTGDYISEDGKYLIEKGSVGWNVMEWDDRFQCHCIYFCSADTLKDAKESV